MLSWCAEVHKKRCTVAAEWCTNTTVDEFQVLDCRDMSDKHPNDADMLDFGGKSTIYFIFTSELNVSNSRKRLFLFMLTRIWKETACDAALNNRHIAMA